MHRGNAISKFIFTTVILFAIWVLLVGNFQINEMIIGFAISLIIALGTFNIFTENGLSHLNPIKIIALAVYIPYYLVLVIIANFDMAYRVLSPSLPIKPGIVEVNTVLKKDSAKLALANSITLTPGTITMDVVKDKLYVHWIYVKDETQEGATMKIVKPFEKLLKVIFS